MASYERNGRSVKPQAQRLTRLGARRGRYLTWALLSARRHLRRADGHHARSDLRAAALGMVAAVEPRQGPEDEHHPRHHPRQGEGQPQDHRLHGAEEAVHRPHERRRRCRHERRKRYPRPPMRPPRGRASRLRAGRPEDETVGHVGRIRHRSRQTGKQADGQMQDRKSEDVPEYRITRASPHRPRLTGLASPASLWQGREAAARRGAAVHAGGAGRTSRAAAAAARAAHGRRHRRRRLAPARRRVARTRAVVAWGAADQPRCQVAHRDRQEAEQDEGKGKHGQGAASRVRVGEQSLQETMQRGSFYRPTPKAPPSTPVSPFSPTPSVARYDSRTPCKSVLRIRPCRHPR